MPGCFEFVQSGIGKDTKGNAKDGVVKTDKEIMAICEALEILALHKNLYKVEMHFNRNHYDQMETKILVDCDEC